MTNIDPEIIRQKFENLPEDLREVISNEENAIALEAIGKKYGLYIDKIGELVEEAGLVMLGFTHPKDFIANLSKRLGVDAEKAKNIAKDVNEQIFAKVRESLKKIHKIGEEEEKNSKSEFLISKQTPMPKSQAEIIEEKPTTPEPKLEISEIKPPTAPPAVEILPEGIQRAPKQFREIKEEVPQAKKEAKYPGDVDPYKEPIE